MTLRVTFEIVPHGEEARKYSVGQLDIHNNGVGALGMYEYYGECTKINYNDEKKVIPFSNVNHHRQDGFLILAKKVIEAIE